MLSPNNKISSSKTRSAIAHRYAINFYVTHLVKTKRSAELGFTLIESLMAAVVVAILIVSIAPMVALSNSARVNARRVDQATQAARSYIDGVRGGVIDTSQFPDNLVRSNAVAANVNAQGQYTFEAVAAPTSTTFPTATMCNNPTTANNVPSGRVPGICVDSNGDGFRTNDPQDFFVQPMRSGPFRTVSTVSTDLTNQGFWLAVRVYRAEALGSGFALVKETDSTCTAKPAFASSSPIVCPIVTMRSQIYLKRDPALPVNLDNIQTGVGSLTP